jgi:hypothetical protein
MSGESTSATLAGFYNDAVVSKLVAPYAIDANVMFPRVRTEMTPPGTKTHSFARVTKDTALSGTITEGNGLSNTALDTDNVDASVAEIGIMRQFTKFGEKTNMLGADGLHNLGLDDGVKMNLEKLETDCWAEASNASTSVGTSGAAFTIADYAAGISQLAINKAKGKAVALLSGTQAKNLRAEVASSGAVFLSNGNGNKILEQTEDDGFMGTFMGANVFTNNLAESSGANKLGLFMVDGGSGKPEQCSTGLSIAWMPEVASLPNVAFSGGLQMAITMAYGIIEILDYAYVKIATIA